MNLSKIHPKFFKAVGQKGSITVMIALLLPVFLLMLALIVNISQLVFTKIRLQSTVDACALSAAAVQAAGLNEISDLNGEMAKEYQKIRGILASGPWYNFGQARNAKDFFYNSQTGVIDWIRRYQKEANVYFAAKAKVVAENVRRRNFPDSILYDHHNKSQLADFKEKFSNAHFIYFAESFSEGSPVLTLRWFNPDNPRYVGTHYGRLVFPAKRMLPLADRFSILEKVKKITPTYVDYELVLPSKAFAVADTIFRGTPVMRAKAAARPAGGHVYREKPEYGAILAR